MNRTQWLTSFAVACALAVSAVAQGAIYTTDSTGTSSLLYVDPLEAHIAGGARPGSASPAGLRDGLYYFQVTDLSGQSLLSQEPLLDRWVEVAGGVFVACDKYPIGFINPPTAPNGSILVPLAPFLPTATMEYRVWLTRQGAYEAGTGLNGFDAVKSKSTAFIVDPSGATAGTTEICGYVYYDFTESGDTDVFDPGAPRDPAEVPLGDWLVQLDNDPPVPADVDGYFSFFVPTDANALVKVTSLVPVEGWVGDLDGRWAPTTFLPAVEGDDQQVTIVPSAPKFRVDFGLLFMENAPGLGFDADEWAKGGGKGTDLRACDSVDEDGNGVADWRQRINSLNLRWNFTVADFNWFHLRFFRPSETLFRVPERGPFHHAEWVLQYYLSQKDRGVLAYMLSRDVCATALNVECGQLDGTTYVDSPQTGDNVLESLDSMFARTSTLLGDDCTSNSGPITSPFYPECNADILNCLTEWGGINSEGSKVYRKSPVPPVVKYGSEDQ